MKKNNNIFNWQADRSKYPELDKNANPIVDLSSHKYTKIWQGPNHPGITGNMSLELTLSGDEIVEAKTHVGYLHRGFEKLIERRIYFKGLATCIRMCVPEADSNEYVYSSCVEDLANIEVPETALWLRTLALEMARLQVLLRTVPGQASTLSLGLGGQWGMYLRDLILDRFSELTGGRIYHMYIVPGGVRGHLPDGFKERMEDNLKGIDEFIIKIEDLIFTNAIFKKRTVGVGVIDPSWVSKYGIVGPNARAAGFKRDVRKDDPYLKYDELDFDVPTATDSDIYTRNLMRKQDLITTVDLIRQILTKIPDNNNLRAKTPNVLHWEIPKGETYHRSESSRGEYGLYMVSDGSKYPRRINLRGPSYTHAVSLLEKMLINANVADVHSIMVSLQTCPPEIER
ncbi:MAG: NADH-quinone oxidoreductase subunit D [Bacteroidota bacterium]|nr:NADH-quinone oxidoreductase subunit D [Bacteroidota bacterium]